MRIATTLIAALLAVAAAVAAAVALGGCASQKDSGGPDPRLRGEWQLIEGSDAGGRLALSNQHITLTIDGDATTTGRSACSDYRARFFGTLSALWVTTSVPANPDCGSQVQQTLEQRYLAILGSVRSATVARGELELIAPSSSASRPVRLRFLRATTLSLTTLVEQQWLLTGASAVGFTDAPPETPVPARGASVVFSGQGTFLLASDCRRLSGRYAQNAEEIVVSHLTVDAEIPCGGADEAVDDYLAKVFRSSFSFEVRNGQDAASSQLVLTNSRAGIRLFFVEYDPA